MNLTTIAITIAAVVTVTVSGCSKDSDSKGETDSAMQSQASAGQSGAASGPPMSSSGFTFFRPGPGSDYSLTSCEGATPDPDATKDLTECNDICGGAHCVDVETAGGSMIDLPNCPATNGAALSVCVPDKIIELAGKYVWTKCVTDGWEGVCMPACLVPESGAVFSERNTCSELERCVPCTNALSGKSNGVCEDRCSDDAPWFTRFMPI